jgi:DNA replication initiation complex subunit (GINS family)
MDEEINYKTLRKIQEIEKNSPVLSELKPDFYKTFIGYLKILNKRLDLEKSSQKQILIRDEIENIKKIVINIYENREKKILLAAISKARGGNPDLKNIIQEEKILFDSVYDLLLKLRKNALEIEKLSEEKENNDNNLDEISVNKNKTKEIQENLNPIIKITQDIPEFVGTDRKKYNLKKNDIISLEDNMSNMLIKKGAAEKINQ